VSETSDLSDSSKAATERARLPPFAAGPRKPDCDSGLRLTRACSARLCGSSTKPPTTAGPPPRHSRWPGCAAEPPQSMASILTQRPPNLRVADGLTHSRAAHSVQSAGQLTCHRSGRRLRQRRLPLIAVRRGAYSRIPAPLCVGEGPGSASGAPRRTKSRQLPPRPGRAAPVVWGLGHQVHNRNSRPRRPGCGPARS
jgi:hypothetical protein